MKVILVMVREVETLKDDPDTGFPCHDGWNFHPSPK
jgi:hypothetical protein